MRQFNIWKGVSDSGLAQKRGLRFRSMNNKEEVERRVKILNFWKDYGTRATKDAFGVSPRTLFRWQSALTQGGGKLEALDPERTAPRRRKRTILPAVEAFIIQERLSHFRLGKKKLAVFLSRERLPCLGAIHR